MIAIQQNVEKGDNHAHLIAVTQVENERAANAGRVESLSQREHFVFHVDAFDRLAGSGLSRRSEGYRSVCYSVSPHSGR